MTLWIIIAAVCGVMVGTPTPTDKKEILDNEKKEIVTEKNEPNFKWGIE
jgi:hypothetical protein